MNVIERSWSMTIVDMGHLWDLWDVDTARASNRASNAPFVPSATDLAIPIGSETAQMAHHASSKGATKGPNGPDVNALEKRDMKGVKGTSGASDTEGDRL